MAGFSDTQGPEVKKSRKEDENSGSSELLTDTQDIKTNAVMDKSPIIHDQNMVKPLPVSVEDTVLNEKINVYIWDMDETLILLKCLLNGTYGAAFDGSKDIQKGIEIGKCWEKYILQVCDDYFFYEQIEDFIEPFLDALIEFDDGRDLSDYDFSKDGFSQPCDDANKRKLAYRYRAIMQKYAQGLHNVFDQEMIKLWENLYALTDSYTDGWLSSARALLEQCLGANKVSTPRLVPPDAAADSSGLKGRNINVLVTSGSLIPSLAKCLLFQLNDLIAHGNVYSSWDVGKLQCFSWIKARFSGPRFQFCVIGDGLEECEAAQTMNWPFIRIDLRPDGFHRFPGLSVKTINHYMDVIYGDSDAIEDDEL